MSIVLKPYEVISDENYDNAVIILTEDLFRSITFLENKTVFNFDSCHFKRLTIINETKIDFESISVHFSYCVIDELNIELVTTEQISLHFHSCIISGSIKSGIIKDVNISNSVTVSLFLFKQNVINVSYTEENIFPRKWMKLLQNANFESLRDLITTKKSIYIIQSKTVNFRFNHNKEDKGGFYFVKYERGSNKKLGYHLTSFDKNSLNIHLNVDFKDGKDSELKINDCIFNSLLLTGASDGKIKIENTDINNFYIRNFTANSQIVLYNISPYLEDSLIEIHKSNMDNTWFDNINFNAYKILSFYRTRFAKASFTSCNFPENILDFEKFKTLENVHYSGNKSENYYKDQYETFLQLKKSLENSGNYFEAQKMSAISRDSLKKIKGLPTSDKFILNLNSISNNHGLSIVQPFLLLLGCSIFFYVLYLYNIDRIFNKKDFDWPLVGQYFTFLDLTHRQDFLISKDDFTFWTLFIDFANKIVVGFLIFQFISAFRKYVLK